MSDLFSLGKPAIEWDGWTGIARDDRVVRLDQSPLSGRIVATIPLHGKDVVTRRSCKNIDQARAAAEAVIEADHG